MTKARITPDVAKSMVIDLVNAKNATINDWPIELWIRPEDENDLAVVSSELNYGVPGYHISHETNKAMFCFAVLVLSDDEKLIDRDSAYAIRFKCPVVVRNFRNTRPNG